MSENQNPPRVLYLSHGGGPLPLLGDPGHREMVELMDQLAPRLGRPSAIVVVSAHWEESQPTLTSGAAPQLLYDYYGFPKESYRIQYPAPGQPALAESLAQSFSDLGMSARLDGQRGFDHGLFVPLKLLFPGADIPCIQLSLLSGLDAAAHIAMGKALAGLAEQNIFLLGSGFSFHNLKAFFSAPSERGLALNRAFDQWLTETCTSAQLSEIQRAQALTNWHLAPGAGYCHPRAEHLLPLQVCYGATGRPARESFRINIMGHQASAFTW